jgi:hypothetical protein
MVATCPLVSLYFFPKFIIVSIKVSASPSLDLDLFLFSFFEPTPCLGICFWELKPFPLVSSIPSSSSISTSSIGAWFCCLPSNSSVHPQQVLDEGFNNVNTLLFEYVGVRGVVDGEEIK